MKILKWNVDKNEKGVKINKARSEKIISYETLSGQIVCESARKIRKAPVYDVKFGRVVGNNAKNKVSF